METERHHDVVVIGGGPAGVSAALECFDSQLETVVLEAGPVLGGQLAEIPHSIRNVATGWFENGAALQAGLQRVAGILGPRVLLEHRVTAADLGAGWVEAAGRRFHGTALLVASGSERRQLAAAPDGAFAGDVTYQVEARPDRFVGRHVVVVGGGDSATLDALELAATAASVRLVHRSEALTARRDLVEQLGGDRRIEDWPGWEVESIHGGEHLEGVVLVHRDGGERRRVAVGGLVVKISRAPRTEAYEGQLELDGRGAVVVDEHLQTSCRGVFAAGDVVAGSYWRVAAALGQGVLAARSVLRHVGARP